MTRVIILNNMKEQTTRMIYGCPKCKCKITKRMWRATKLKFVCSKCGKASTKDELEKRDKNYFNQIIGHRLVKSHKIDPDTGKELREMESTEVPRIRKGNKGFDESRLYEFTREGLLEKIKSFYFSTSSYYNVNPKVTKHNFRDAALIAFLFLTGCRVSEAVGIKRRDKETDNVYYLLDPIYKRQIILAKMKSNNELIFKVMGMPILKRKNETKYLSEVAGMQKRIVPRRNVILPYKYEKEFVKIIMNWVKHVPEHKPLFDISRKRVSDICFRFYMTNPHFWRHLRATDLVITYNFSGLQQQHFFGWSSSKMAEKYSHLNQNTLLEGMFNGYTKGNNEEKEMELDKINYNPNSS